MKVAVDGMILYGTPEEILEYQELYKRKQNEKAEAKLNITNNYNGLSEKDAKKIIDDITNKLNVKPIVFGSYKFS